MEVVAPDKKNNIWHHHLLDREPSNPMGVHTGDFQSPWAAGADADRTRNTRIMRDGLRSRVGCARIGGGSRTGGLQRAGSASIRAGRPHGRDRDEPAGCVGASSALASKATGLSDCKGFAAKARGSATRWTEIAKRTITGGATPGLVLNRRSITWVTEKFRGFCVRKISRRIPHA